MKAVAAQTRVRVRTILTTLAERFDQFSKHTRERALLLALHAPQDVEVNLDAEYPREVIRRYDSQMRDWAQANAGSIFHAIRQIARSNARDAVELLSQWLRQDTVSHLQDIAILASQDLFYRSSSANLVLTSERHLPLLDLIGPLLTADVQATQIVLHTLLRWLRNPDWPNQIHRALLRVANRVAEQEAKSLQSVLLHEWLDSDQIEAHQIASSVLGRLSMMRGCPMDMPENGQAVIILDAAPEACRGRNAANAGYQLHARLDALLDTWVLRMGQSEALVQPRHPKPSPQLQPAYPRPRLLVPALDSLDPERVALALALAWKSPLDGEDLVGGPWPERLIAAFADGASLADALPMADGAHQQKGAGQSHWCAKAITMPANSLSLHHLENAILQQLARSLADRPAAAWWSALENAIGLPENDLTGIRERLTQWTALLDDEQHADLARTILCGTLWLCATDPGEYVSLLSEWFESPDELTRLAAAACGTAIFRLYAECRPSPDLERVSVLLDLAPFLAKEGWRRAQVVVAAARRWSKDPAWATRLLVRPDGGTGEIIRMVDSLPLSDHSKLQIELASWLDASAVQKESSEPVRKLVQRLQVQMALAVRTSLPELPAGHAYVMMVLDHANGHSKTVRDIAEMARHLIERLNQTDQEALHVLVYRLGQDVPIAGPEERPSVEQLSVQAQPLRPRVLGPLLELYSPRQIGAVILLTGSPPLDAEDWVGTEWNQHMLVYTVSRRSHEHPIFDTIPQQSSTEATGTLIVQRLRQITGV